MIKIGFSSSHIGSETIAQGFQAFLKDKIENDSATYPVKTLEEICQAIQKAEISVGIYPLSLLPSDLPKGVVITALSDRKNASYSLIIPIENMDSTQVFSLKTGAKVVFQEEILRAQFEEFRSDISTLVHKLSEIDMLTKVHEGTYDACVLATENLQFLNLDETKYHILTFNPKELTPLAGQGVIAYLAAEDDFKTRSALKTAFENVKLPSGIAVSTVTNIERKLKMLFNGEPVAVYVEIDHLKNYHIRAVGFVQGDLKKVRLSQSTYFELAERCFEQFK